MPVFWPSRRQWHTWRSCRCPACRPACKRTCRRRMGWHCEYPPRRGARRSGERSRKGPIRPRQLIFISCAISLLQAGHRHEDLECRAGSQLGLDSLVHERVVGVVDELIPVGSVDAHGEGIGVEAGTRDHGQNLAVAGVHGHEWRRCGCPARVRRRAAGRCRWSAEGPGRDGVLDTQVATSRPWLSTITSREPSWPRNSSS